MENKFKVTFWLYTAKKNKQNLTPIYLRVWSNYKFFTRSTGLFIKKSLWDKKAMRAKGVSAEATSINSQLDGLYVKIMNKINQLQMRGQPFDVEVIKKMLDGEDENQMTLMRVFTEHLKLMKKLLNKEYSKATIVKYTNTKLRLKQFLRFRFKRKDIYLYELNYDFMKSFEYFLRDKFDNNTTTIYKHYQRFTRILKIAIQKGYIINHPFPEYRIKQPKKKIEYLTQEEVDKLIYTDFRVERLNIIRDVFVFCIYTGLAYAEVSQLTPDNLTIGADKKQWLNIHRKKTKKPYQVPLLPVAEDILNKYKDDPKCIIKNKLLPVPSNVKYNAYLKEIATIAGIKINLTTHIARKTFATTIMLANGVNIGVLSKLLGHASIQVTLDSYGTFSDQLMLNQVDMIRQMLGDTPDKNKEV